MLSDRLSSSPSAGAPPIAPPTAPPGPAGPAASGNVVDTANQRVGNCSFPSSCTFQSSISHNNGLNIAHVNINSITAPNRLDELEQFTYSNNIHVLCTSETKLDSTVHPSQYTMTSFSPPFTRHRTRHGGGVAIYIRDNIAATRDEWLEMEGIEWIWAKIKIKSQTLLICCIYFPPNQSAADLKCFLEKLSESVLQAQVFSPSFIAMLGDFNTGNVYLKHEYAHQHSGVTNHDILLYETVSGLNLKQLIKEPTRITSTTANLRDLILVSDEQQISSCGALSPFSQIDHFPVYVNVKYETKRERPSTKEVWDYQNTNIDRLIDILAQTNWNDIIVMT